MYVHIVHYCARSVEVDRVVDRYRVQGRGICFLAQERALTQDEHGVQPGAGVLRPRGRIRKEVSSVHHSGNHLTTCLGWVCTTFVDTVRVGADKATFLTDGVKSSKETLFFLNTAEDEDEKPSKATKAPPTKPVVNGSPVKHKTVGGKVS